MKQEVAELKRKITRTLHAAKWRSRTGPPEDVRCLWAAYDRLTAQLRSAEGRQTP